MRGPGDVKVERLAGLLGESHELGDGVGSECRVRHEHDRHRDNHADAGEVLERVVGQRLVDRGIDREGIGDNAQRVTIGFRPGKCCGRHDRPGAGPVLDDDGFTPAGAQTLAEDAHDHIGGAAGRERHDDRHVSRGKGLAQGRATYADSGQAGQRKAKHASR